MAAPAKGPRRLPEGEGARWDPDPAAQRGLKAARQDASDAGRVGRDAPGRAGPAGED